MVCIVEWNERVFRHVHLDNLEAGWDYMADRTMGVGRQLGTECQHPDKPEDEWMVIVD